MDERVREIDYGPNFPHLPMGTPTTMTLQKLLSRGQVYFPPLAFGLVFDFLWPIEYSRSNDMPVAAPTLSQNPVQLSHEQIWASLLEAERPHVAEPRHPS